MTVSVGNWESLDSNKVSDLISEGKPVFLTRSVESDLESMTGSEAMTMLLVQSSRIIRINPKTTIFDLVKRIFWPREWNSPSRRWTYCSGLQVHRGKQN